MMCDARVLFWQHKKEHDNAVSELAAETDATRIARLRSERDHHAEFMSSMLVAWWFPGAERFAIGKA